ncbi:DUF3380 domain-containing protein, partial [Escherichia coli]|uniref:N-acetylmuramidase domain-containing protein n=5 Tax=Pseudomonadota TaxID=1224 RepID=UPI0016554919
DALRRALGARQWAAFARAYNGPDYAANLYDVKLARAFDRYASQSAAPAPTASVPADAARLA